jgi:hypothetical protein
MTGVFARICAKRRVARGVLCVGGMLRSIIAIWTIALGLIIAAANMGCYGGCLDGEDCSAGLGTGPDMAGPEQPRQCSTTCPTCGRGEICAQATEVSPFCARTCTTDADCDSSETCALLVGSTRPVCIARGTAQGCRTTSDTYSCIPSTSCKDAMTMQQGFAYLDDRICGWELKPCANGCVDGQCK